MGRPTTVTGVDSKHKHNREERQLVPASRKLSYDDLHIMSCTLTYGRKFCFLHYKAFLVVTYLYVYVVHI